MPNQTPNDLAINEDYIDFAAICGAPEEIAGEFPITWEQYDEDGLGRAAAAGFYLDEGGFFMLRHLYQAPICATVLMLAADTRDPESKIESTFEDFGFTSRELVWLLGGLRFGSFDLSRQDDNGREYQVDRFPFRPDAIARLRQLEAGGHKQHYEVRRSESETLSLQTDADGLVIRS